MVTSEPNPTPDDAVGPPPRPPGILIADDEELVRVVLETTFRQHGFAVWLAADGLEATQVYRQHADGIDLVLLDVRMPGLDGPQTLTALLRITPGLRCCFMTGAPGLYNVEVLLARGAADVLSKPFVSLSALVARLRQFLPGTGDEAGGETKK
jgi:CheY-like chemotaxis protein